MGWLLENKEVFRIFWHFCGLVGPFFSCDLSVRRYFVEGGSFSASAMVLYQSLVNGVTDVIGNFSPIALWFGGKDLGLYDMSFLLKP